jgi:lipooligosaccharide transport system ATP-binding protein
MEEAERLCHRIAVMDAGSLIAQGSPRELIRDHIEPQVVEVHGVGFEAWEERARARRLAPRIERAGETVFCYTPDPEAVLADLRDSNELVYLHRPANLEDVFLKLTGRDLRD